MIIDCIADLHGYFPDLEGGDLLIIAGDMTGQGKIIEWAKFFNWLDKQDYKKKIVVGGNHDNFFQTGFPKSQKEAEELKDVKESLDIRETFEYLCDSATEFEGLKIWGSPWTLKFQGQNPLAMAFTCDSEEELSKKWAMIPPETDILITHSPPYGILDKTKRGESVGSRALTAKIGLMQKPPKLWVWGHIHEAYGKDLPLRGKNCEMINASHVNERYEPVNKPIRVII